MYISVYYYVLRRSASQCLLQRQYGSTSHGNRSLAVAAPTLWNYLPIHIRSADSVERLKTLLKTHLNSLLIFNLF